MELPVLGATGEVTAAGDLLRFNACRGERIDPVRLYYHDFLSPGETT